LPIYTRRKIIDLGGSNTVTLPKNWTDGSGVNPGDTVEVYADGILLIVPAGYKLDRQRAIKILEEAH
jgi:bifunctional DNA-binding transcriptional regulator/antitoxin component of YhaV-PrlF toxin-antitoxin module